MANPTQQEALDTFRYDPETGELFWKRAPRPQHKGTDIPAGYAHPSGYRFVRWKNKAYAQHRLIWFMVHGEWPERIDHADRDKGNNRISNLRPATASQNILNSGLRKDNTSGTKGVRFSAGHWRVDIRINGHLKYLGRYKNKDDAVARRKEVEEALVKEGVCLP